MRHFNTDVHGMTVSHLKNYLGMLVKFMPKEVDDICIIHGYHNGEKLKHYLRNEFSNDRVVDVQDFGEGRTILKLN